MSYLLSAPQIFVLPETRSLEWKKFESFSLQLDFTTLDVSGASACDVRRTEAVRSVSRVPDVSTLPYLQIHQIQAPKQPRPPPFILQILIKTTVWPQTQWNVLRSVSQRQTVSQTAANSPTNARVLGSREWKPKKKTTWACVDADIFMAGLSVTPGLDPKLDEFWMSLNLLSFSQSARTSPPYRHMFLITACIWLNVARRARRRMNM